MGGERQHQASEQPGGHHHQHEEQRRDQALVERSRREDIADLAQADEGRGEARIGRVLVEGELEVLEEGPEREDGEDGEARQQQGIGERPVLVTARGLGSHAAASIRAPVVASKACRLAGEIATRTVSPRSGRTSSWP